MSSTHDILVVDDHPSILDDFARLLAAPAREADQALDSLAAMLGATATPRAPSTPSYRLHCAGQGLEAIDIHRQLASAGTSVAVAFVDIQMPPGIDGVETVSRLWRAQPDLEVVLCTAYSDYSWHSILERLERRDQLVILRKPFDPIEVRQLAACLSEKWSRGRALARRMDELQDQVNREVARRLEAERHQRQKFEELGKLAAGIAHEINTPLQYVQSNLDTIAGVLGDLAAGPEVDRDALIDLPSVVDDACEGVRRIATTVRSAREYAHTRQSTALEMLDVNEEARMVAELVRGQFKRDAEIVLDLQPTPAVPGNADALSRALLNLVINAAHAIQSSRTPGMLGRITIRTRTTPSAVHVDVEDTGGGIPRELWDHVFEPFFTTKPRGEGTGQGLAIARAAIVDVHHGTLTFDSTPGSGTAFHVTLPHAPAAATPPT